MLLNYKNNHSVVIISPVPPPNGGMAMQANKMAMRLKQEGTQVLIIPTNPSFPKNIRWSEKVKGFRTVIRFMLYVYRLLKIKNCDIVHIYAASHLFFFVVVVPAIVFGKLFNKKVILNYHGGEAESFFSRWGKLVYPFLILADVIAVPSEFLSKIFLNKFGLKVEILPNIADSEQFRFRKRDLLSPRLIVSRHLEPLYNHVTILKAFKKILEIYPTAVLKIAGDGSLRKSLEAYAVDLKLTNVFFLGSLSQEKLYEAYNESDIMLNASIADNFPGALVEAFLCGISVVSSNAGGIPLLVNNGVTGLLVSPMNDDQFVNAVKNLISMPNDAQQMAKAAYDFAQMYTWPSVRSKVLGMYGIDL